MAHLTLTLDATQDVNVARPQPATQLRVQAYQCDGVALNVQLALWDGEKAWPLSQTVTILDLPEDRAIQWQGKTIVVPAGTYLSDLDEANPDGAVKRGADMEEAILKAAQAMIPSLAGTIA